MNGTLAGEFESADWTVVGRRIRELRTDKGLTQGQVADNLISVAYLSRIEAGQRRPDPRVLERLASRLETTAEHLLSGVPRERGDEVSLTIRYADLALNSGDPSAAASALEGLFTRPGPMSGQQKEEASWVLAAAKEGLGDYPAAIRLLEDISAAPRRRHPAEVGVALSRCYREAGDLERAIEVARHGLAECERLSLTDSDEAVQLMVTLAAGHFERGDVVVATNLCQDAIERAERMGSTVARASAYWNASMVANQTGRPGALALAERALALFSEAGDARRLARLRLLIGLMLVDDPAGDVTRAHRELRNARTALVEAGASPSDVSRCDAGLALVAVARGELDEAWQLATAARDAAVPAPIATAEAETVLGRIAFARGDKADARARFIAAARALAVAQADREVAQLWFQLGALLDDAGDAEAARDAYRSAAAASGLRAAPVVRSPVPRT